MAVGVLHALAGNEIMAEMVKEDQRGHKIPRCGASDQHRRRIRFCSIICCCPLTSRTRTWGIPHGQQIYPPSRLSLFIIVKFMAINAFIVKKISNTRLPRQWFFAQTGDDRILSTLSESV